MRKKRSFVLYSWLKITIKARNSKVNKDFRKKAITTIIIKTNNIFKANFKQREINNFFIIIRFILKNFADSQLEYLSYVFPVWFFLFFQKFPKKFSLKSVYSIAESLLEFCKNNQAMNICSKWNLPCNSSTSKCFGCKDISQAYTMALSTIKYLEKNN